MMTLEQVRRALHDRNMTTVAAATGLNRHTIARVKNDTAKEPTYYVIRRLSDYLSGPIDTMPRRDAPGYDGGKE
jgi:transcriptional regulator with XRE-family HTH domain